MSALTTGSRALILLGLVYLLVLLQASGGGASPAWDKREQLSDPSDRVQKPGPRELEFKEYLKNLRSYMSLIARPRFGKRSDTP
uniref:Pancreatic hormone n=1 Tax=Macrostomum lignano TaxID=282301 RepID=A0A1I8JDA1_9PLAT